MVGKQNQTEDQFRLSSLNKMRAAGSSWTGSGYRKMRSRLRKVTQGKLSFPEGPNEGLEKHDILLEKVASIDSTLSETMRKSTILGNTVAKEQLLASIVTCLAVLTQATREAKMSENGEQSHERNVEQDFAIALDTERLNRMVSSLNDVVSKSSTRNNELRNTQENMGEEGAKSWKHSDNSVASTALLPITRPPSLLRERSPAKKGIAHVGEPIKPVQDDDVHSMVSTVNLPITRPPSLLRESSAAKKAIAHVGEPIVPVQDDGVHSMVSTVNLPITRPPSLLRESSAAKKGIAHVGEPIMPVQDREVHSMISTVQHAIMKPPFIGKEKSKSLKVSGEDAGKAKVLLEEVRSIVATLKNAFSNNQRTNNQRSNNKRSTIEENGNSDEKIEESFLEDEVNQTGKSDEKIISPQIMGKVGSIVLSLRREISKSLPSIKESVRNDQIGADDDADTIVKITTNLKDVIRALRDANLTQSEIEKLPEKSDDSVEVTLLAPALGETSLVKESRAEEEMQQSFSKSREELREGIINVNEKEIYVTAVQVANDIINILSNYEDRSDDGGDDIRLLSSKLVGSQTCLEQVPNIVDSMPIHQSLAAVEDSLVSPPTIIQKQEDAKPEIKKNKLQAIWSSMFARSKKDKLSETDQMNLQEASKAPTTIEETPKEEEINPLKTVESEFALLQQVSKDKQPEDTKTEERTEDCTTQQQTDTKEQPEDMGSGDLEENAVKALGDTPVETTGARPINNSAAMDSSKSLFIVDLMMEEIAASAKDSRDKTLCFGCTDLGESLKTIEAAVFALWQSTPSQKTNNEEQPKDTQNEDQDIIEERTSHLQTDSTVQPADMKIMGDRYIEESLTRNIISETVTNLSVLSAQRQNSIDLAKSATAGLKMNLADIITSEDLKNSEPATTSSTSAPGRLPDDSTTFSATIVTPRGSSIELPGMTVAGDKDALFNVYRRLASDAMTNTATSEWKNLKSNVDEPRSIVGVQESSGAEAEPVLRAVPK